MKNKQQNAPEKSEVFCVVGNLKKERFVLRGGTLRFIFSERFVLRIIHAVVWCKSGDEMYESMAQLQINAVGVVPLIAQGWRQPTLGYVCSMKVNAVGVVRFLRGMLR